tara:strand:+ start:653 stop:1093 length:441 start_codon:yes stop_codon:yes gene_type:complete
MNEAIHFIRQKIITLLTNAITVDGEAVPVYNKVPQNATEPFIKVYSVDTEEIDQNQTSFNIICTTRIDVVTSFVGDTGGELLSNQIVSSILNLVRTRSSGYVDLSSDGFNVYTSVLDKVKYIEDVDEDKTFYKGVITLENRVEKTS